MRDALRLMAKVFAVVFGAGSAIVVLLYMLLVGYYVYGRIELPNKAAKEHELTTKAAKEQASQASSTVTFVETYEPNSAPKVLPNAQLDCPSDKKSSEHGPLEELQICSVLIDGRVVALISRENAKNNLTE
jgi:hypothetical protein